MSWEDALEADDLPDEPSFAVLDRGRRLVAFEERLAGIAGELGVEYEPPAAPLTPSGIDYRLTAAETMLGVFERTAAKQGRRLPLFPPESPAG